LSSFWLEYVEHVGTDVDVARADQVIGVAQLELDLFVMGVEIEETLNDETQLVGNDLTLTVSRRIHGLLIVVLAAAHRILLRSVLRLVLVVVGGRSELGVTVGKAALIVVFAGA